MCIQEVVHPKAWLRTPYLTQHPLPPLPPSLYIYVSTCIIARKECFLHQASYRPVPTTNPCRPYQILNVSAFLCFGIKKAR